MVTGSGVTVIGRPVVASRLRRTIAPVLGSQRPPVILKAKVPLAMPLALPDPVLKPNGTPAKTVAPSLLAPFFVLVFADRFHIRTVTSDPTTFISTAAQVVNENPPQTL